MQPNAELLKYIQEQSGQGWSMEQIMPELLSFGWPEEEIQVALQWLRSQNPEAEATLPQQSEQNLTTSSPAGVIVNTPVDPAYPQQQPEPYPNLAANPGYPQTPPPETVAVNNTVQPQEFNTLPQLVTSVPVSAPVYTPSPYVAEQPTLDPSLAPFLPPQPVSSTTTNTPITPNYPAPPISPQPLAPPQPTYPAPQPGPTPTQNVIINPTVPTSTPVAPVAPTQATQATQTLQATQPTAPATSPFLNSFMPPQTNAQKIKRMLAILFIAVAVIGAALLLWSIVSDSPESAFKKTVQKSLLTGSFERDYTTTSIGEGLVIHAKIKSDFNDPAKPKSTATIEATLEFGPESTIDATYEMVAIEDTIWLRTTDIQTNLDSATVSSYQELSQGGNAESIITSLVGADRLNEWTEYTYSPSYVTTFGLTYSLVRFGFSVNSPLSEFPIANTNKHSTTATNLVLGSGMLSVNYDKVDSEKIDSVNYKVYKASYNSDAFEQTAKNLAELLDLSQRHRDAITEKDIHVTDGEIQLWVDPGSKLPYQIKAPRDGTDIIYSGYGSNFDIKSPLTN